MKAFTTALTIILVACSTYATEYHVSTRGLDDNTGSISKPFKTISEAAAIAQPGDTITVHEGVYRERVNPPRGGLSDQQRIVYQAAPGETVVIKGSEVIKGWQKVKDDVWKVVLPNSFFGDFNPFNDLIQGHWFDPKGREHHTGAVYLNGKWLTEAVSLDEVMALAGESALWFGQVDDQHTTVYAQFPGIDPNQELVEVNARRTVFYPDQPGINYITVRGFTLTQAATPWAPPTVEQVGLIGTHWSKGWVIENNIISHSICSGLTLGLKDMGEFLGNAMGYTKMIQHALDKGGWNKENIGHHVVFGNQISDCEQAGICGSLGGAFSRIENNEVSNIHVRRLFHGQEQGGIKLHGAVDVLIRNNCVHGTPRGIWLDWMGQGSIISENLAYNNSTADLYLEVNHGPILVANNILLSNISLSNRSRGTAFVNNLFGGRSGICGTTRTTPYMKPHSIAVAGMHENYPGDDRFYNNIFAVPVKQGQTAMFEQKIRNAKTDVPVTYEDEKLPLEMDGNLYINGSIPYARDSKPMILEQETANLEVIRKEDGFYIEWTSSPAWVKGQKRKLVTTEMLGRARVPDMKFENADGSPITVNIDYFGNKRNTKNPYPGPFTKLKEGKQLIKVWPRK